jgi:hypothetical protein
LMEQRYMLNSGAQSDRQKGGGIDEKAIFY